MTASATTPRPGPRLSHVPAHGRNSSGANAQGRNDPDNDPLEFLPNKSPPRLGDGAKVPVMFALTLAFTATFIPPGLPLLARALVSVVGNTASLAPAASDVLLLTLPLMGLLAPALFLVAALAEEARLPWSRTDA